MNLPNVITIGRFGVALLFFGVLAIIEAGALPEHNLLLYDIALVLFFTGGLSDVVDGYLARKMNNITAFGRMADPLADKVLVNGAFVFFLALDRTSPFLAGWMVIVILSREFLVSGLRSLAETKGIPFPATFWGKQKMFFQSMTIMGLLLWGGHLYENATARAVIQALVWVTVISTAFSGLTYCIRIWKLWPKEESA